MKALGKRRPTPELQAIWKNIPGLSSSIRRSVRPHVCQKKRSTLNGLRSLLEVLCVLDTFVCGEYNERKFVNPDVLLVSPTYLQRFLKERTRRVEQFDRAFSTEASFWRRDSISMRHLFMERVGTV